jgi:chromosome segregation ATPase
LEENQSRSSSSISTIQTSLAALTIAVAAAERSANNNKPLDSLEKKLEKEISGVSREMSQVKSSVQNIERNNNTLLTRLTAVERRVPSEQPQPQAPAGGTPAQRK